ncbi:MAG: carboxypeptidase-like regulatory domain-containing protein [Ferruginibacter sp.]|nr:carboxypeptidase-like regulatory domain-containing protein [Ferruginibacter sp.]
MNTFRHSILFLVIIFFTTVSFAQQISFSGTVIDGHTKEPVSFASVYFARSGVGKTTDSAGHFSFVLNNFKNDTLKVSFIGFEIYKIPITPLQNNQNLNIQLERGTAKGEVIIKAKWNRGLFLWKKIMSKKKNPKTIKLS